MGQSIFTNGLSMLADNTNPEFTDRNRWLFSGLVESGAWRRPRGAPDLLGNIFAYDDQNIYSLDHNIDRSQTLGSAKVYAYVNPKSQGKTGMNSKLKGIERLWNKSYRGNNDRLKSLVATDNHLFVIADRGGLNIYAQSDRDARITIHEKVSGTILNHIRIPSAPVFDGMAINDQFMIVSLMDGTVLCLQPSDANIAAIGGDAEVVTKLRVNCGSLTDYTDKQGRLWHADQEFEQGSWGYVDGGIVTRNPQDIFDSEDDRLFLTEHYSMSAYRFPVKNGSYRIKLHFAETWKGNNAVGKRAIDVRAEDVEMVKGLDVFKNAGERVFAPCTIEKVIAVIDNELTLEFSGKGFMINAIEFQAIP
ncbi:MAG: hypothetical protein HRU15_06885 [Planctomycetes bacterium]|nr:hypothetical protein [Planctomycetota bacterium]